MDRSDTREIRLSHSDTEQQTSGARGGAIAGAVLGIEVGIAGGPPRFLRAAIAAPLLAGLGAGIGSMTHPLSDEVIYRRTEFNKNTGKSLRSPR